MKYLFKKIEPKWQQNGKKPKSSKPKITVTNLNSMVW